MKIYRTTSIEKDSKEAWIREIIKFPDTYTSFSFPDKLKNDPDVIDVLKSIWIKKLKENPANYGRDDFPEVLKNNEDVLVILKRTLMEWLNDNPSLFHIIPQFLKDDPDILKVIKNGCIYVLNNRPSYYFNKSFPQGLKNDPDIINAIKSGISEVLKRNPNTEIDENFNDIISADFILQARKDGWIELLKEYPENYSNTRFPSELKNDEDILSTPGVIDHILKDVDWNVIQ